MLTLEISACDKCKDSYFDNWSKGLEEVDPVELSATKNDDSDFWISVFDFEDVFFGQNVHALLALEVDPDLAAFKSVVLTVYTRLSEVYLISRRGLHVRFGNEAG